VTRLPAICLLPAAKSALDGKKQKQQSSKNRHSMVIDVNKNKNKHFGKREVN